VNYIVNVIETQYTFQITFNGDSGFVASVPRANELAFSEALPPRNLVLKIIFRLHRPYCVFYFVL